MLSGSLKLDRLSVGLNGFGVSPAFSTTFAASMEEVQQHKKTSPNRYVIARVDWISIGVKSFLKGIGLMEKVEHSSMAHLKLAADPQLLMIAK
jgi:hypothetical protein